MVKVSYIFLQCTWNPDGVVDLAIGESGIEAEKPITVGELFKDVVARFPKRPALKYKEGGIWKTITYTGYYGLCIKAAKSFLKVRVGAPYLNCTVDVLLMYRKYSTVVFDDT